MKARALVLAIVVCGCTHDYDALKGPSATGGSSAGGNSAGGGHGGSSGGSSVAGTNGSAGTTGNAGTTGVAGTGGVGGSVVSCGAGQVMCADGACVPTGGDGTALHCGGCNACPTGATCSNGTCGCAPGLLLCGAACVPSDSTHCGSCTRVCSGTTVCSGGMCVSACAANQTMCSGGACIPVGGDGTVAHCGGCNACPAGATVCNNGTCGCSVAGQMVCGTACVDTNTSASHCGGCNRPCAGTCVNGTCTATCGSAFEVAADGFVRLPAAGGGCWRGYAFLGGDAGSTVTPRDFSTCGTPCTLRMSGTVGPAVAPSYSGVAYLGFNLGQNAGSTTAPLVTPAGSGLTIAFSATTATLPLRVQLTSGGSTFWCYTITGASPATIPYASFNTACWDNSGTAYAKQPIQALEMVVPGGATATAGVSVTLISVKEN